MNVLLVHPGPLMYTKIYLRLEPLGLELVASAARALGHRVTLLDLQVESSSDFVRLLSEQRPDAVGFSCSYLANVPEIVDLAKLAKRLLPRCAVFVGGHSASFIADALLAHGEGVIDCVLKGEGEAAIDPLLAALADQRTALGLVPGAVTASGEGPPVRMLEHLDVHRPARDLVRHRRKYFIGVLDPCASIEFTRGCPWDCSFCSAWTFYGRSYRVRAPEAIVEDLGTVHEPGVFIVDDVAFIQAKHGLAIGEAIASRGITKRYYLETRGDVLLRNKKVFRFWKTLGLAYMFIGIEAIDEEGLALHRKRITLSKNFEALELREDPSGSRSPSISSPIRHGIAAVSRSCASGAWRFPKSSISASTLPIPARRPGIPRLATSPLGTTGCTTFSTPSSPPNCPCLSSIMNSCRRSRFSIVNTWDGMP